MFASRQVDELSRRLRESETALVAAQIDRDHAQNKASELQARLDQAHLAEIQVVNSLKNESSARLKAEALLAAQDSRLAEMTHRAQEAETRYHDLIKQAMAPLPPATVLPVQPDFEQRADKAVNTQGRRISDDTVERMVDHVMRTSGVDKDTAIAEVSGWISTDTLTADESGLMGFLHDATVSRDPDDYLNEPTGHEALADAEQES